MGFIRRVDYLKHLIGRIAKEFKQLQWEVFFLQFCFGWVFWLEN